MNSYKNVLGIIISSIILGLLLFAILLFTTWGILISVDTIFTIATTIPLIYFLLVLFISSNNENMSPQGIGTLNFLANQIGMMVIIPIITVIVVFIYAGVDESLNPNYKLFKYSGYPCENKIFTTTDKTALVAHNKSFMHEAAYFITRNTLEDYKDYLNNRHWTEYIEKNIYPKGSKFKVIGFYWPYGNIRYFLIQDVEDNKTIAWVSHNEFDAKECHVNFYSQQRDLIQNNTFTPKNGEYNETEIDLSQMQMRPFI